MLNLVAVSISRMNRGVGEVVTCLQGTEHIQLERVSFQKFISQFHI